MIGVYDFCGHYEWTFAWLQTRGGSELLREYWDKAIHLDSQSHAARLILEKGIAGMQEYWGHTLAEEGGTHQTTATNRVFRIDMRDCPSKGFLLRNGLKQHSDYCEHCIGWVGPLLKRAGFVVDHQHNHCGQCWWEIRRATDPAPPSRPGELAGSNDIRLGPEWQPQAQSIDSYSRANGPEEKSRSSGPGS
jgi:hypothetical protein